MKKLFSIILLSLVSMAAFAQGTVTGSVKDAATGEPLIGVGVIVSTGGGAVTDLDGTYAVKAGKDATIHRFIKSATTQNNIGFRATPLSLARCSFTTMIDLPVP